MPKFRILCIDGGGLRGIVTIKILRKIEEISNKKIYEMFDMMAGTSTGGLIVSCLTLPDASKPGTPKYMLDYLEMVYTDDGDGIFPVTNSLGSIFRKISNLCSPEFSYGIEHNTKPAGTGCRIKDAIRPIIVPAFDLNSNQPVFFKTSTAAEDDSANALVYDVCRATSATPTHLSPYSFEYRRKLLTGIDGSICINNPTMAALTEISKYGNKGYYKKSDGNPVALEDVFVLSLGTGTYAGKATEDETGKWGEGKWTRPIMDAAMNGMNRIIDYQAQEMMNAGQYLRLDINIDDKSFADTTDARPEARNYLLQATDKMLNQKMQEITSFMQAAEMMASNNAGSDGSRRQANSK